MSIAVSVVLLVLAVVVFGCAMVVPTASARLEPGDRLTMQRKSISSEHVNSGDDREHDLPALHSETLEPRVFPFSPQGAERERSGSVLDRMISTQLEPADLRAAEVSPAPSGDNTKEEERLVDDRPLFNPDEIRADGYARGASASDLTAHAGDEPGALALAELLSHDCTTTATLAAYSIIERLGEGAGEAAIARIAGTDRARTILSAIPFAS